MFNNKIILSFLTITFCFLIKIQGQTIYTNDMDYVIGDTKQAFIQNRVKTNTHADNLLKALKTMKFNGIRIPIFPRDATTGVDVNPDKAVMDYFYQQALAQGFLIFANPAQGGGGARIANNSLNNGGGVNGVQAATDELVERVIEFSNEYPDCKWLNPFNEDGRATNSTWSVSQIHEVYERLYNHGVNGAELIGPCTWGLPAGIDMLQNTNIEDYITVATSHNLGHHDNQWDDFIALAKARDLPVWDSEANNDPGNTSVNKFEAALANKVDGLVVYNAGNNVNLNTGGVNTTNIYYMSRYLKERPGNLALNGVATQSVTTSTSITNLHAPQAIDGNIVGVWGSGSISHTDGNNPWWQVDLGADKEIEEINIYNRTDNRTLLSDFTVIVTDAIGVTTFTKRYTEYPDPILVIETGDIKGRIVKIQKNVEGVLSLGEVQVFSQKESLSTKNVDKINLNIYPNPIVDKLNISSPTNIFKNYTIYNIHGQIIATEKVNSKELKLNLSTYLKGVYILKLEGDQFLNTHKIIKN